MKNELWAQKSLERKFEVSALTWLVICEWFFSQECISEDFISKLDALELWSEEPELNSNDFWPSTNISYPGSNSHHQNHGKKILIFLKISFSSDISTLTIWLFARYLWVTELAHRSKNNNFILPSINSAHLYLFSLLHHHTKYKGGGIESESTFMYRVEIFYFLHSISV